MAILSETIVIPIWATAVVAAAAIVVAVLIRRVNGKQQIAAGIAAATVLAALAIAVPLWAGRDAHGSSQQALAATASELAAERRALETRRAELTARATVPGSPLACLDALAGEPVESACERSVFASPVSVAVAVSYAGARLRLLADGVGFARRADPSYEASFADLRLAAENDAYGIYAHVLAIREGCTPERCAAFALLRNPTTLKLHLRQRLYGTYVAEHRDRWEQPTGARAKPVAAAPAAVEPAPAVAPAVTAVVEPPAATTAMAPATSASPSTASTPASTVATPIPKARPTTIASRSDPLSAASPVAEMLPAAAEVPPAQVRGVVPPAASVLPNIDFPTSSSIPAINIMAAEPKLPPGNDASAAGQPAVPRRSPSPQ